MTASPQTTCLKCGATILESTAARTGGMCMPCKDGFPNTPQRVEEPKKPATKPEPEEPFEWREIVELLLLGALGWFLGIWVFGGLSIPLAFGTGLLAFALIFAGFGFGENLRQRVRLYGIGGGWFLLAAAGPFAALRWLIAWLVPSVARDRLAIFLGAIALTIALVLLLKTWMHRND